MRPVWLVKAALIATLIVQRRRNRRDEESGRAQQQQVTLNASLAEGLPEVLGNRIQLQQVLLNLLLNACDGVKDCEPGSRHVELRSRIESDGTALLVVVTDHGHGIAADSLERVFDAFFTTKPNGLGLGLAICRQIVAAHGGRLWATHNSGRGAAFHMTLPVSNAVRERERAIV